MLVDQMKFLSKKSIFIILSIIGLVISLYLTLYHYDSQIPLECPTRGIINCESVLNSSYAYLLGLPLALYGLAFFVLEFVVIWLENKEIMALYNAMGIGFVFYFIYSEALIGSICIYCTFVHVIVVILFIFGIYDIIKKENTGTIPLTPMPM